MASLGDITRLLDESGQQEALKPRHLPSPQPGAGGTPMERHWRSNDTGSVRARDLRREPRETVCGRGELTWDDGVAARQIPVGVRNISDHGMQVIAPKRVAVGISVFLTGEQFRCIGTVRYCESDSGGFLVGLEFNREPHHKNAVAEG